MSSIYVSERVIIKCRKCRIYFFFCFPSRLHRWGSYENNRERVGACSQCWCQGQDVQSVNLWPLVTPVMGNISSGCCEASKQYITLLEEALSAPMSVTDEQRAALKMLDSNGPLPFLQEGMLQVMTTS